MNSCAWLLFFPCCFQLKDRLFVSSQTFVGSYIVSNGPPYADIPATYTCVQACALIFGGTSSQYSGSLYQDSVSSTCNLSGYATSPGCHVLSDSYSFCDFYNIDGCYSAYVADSCGAVSNYCWIGGNPSPNPSANPTAIPTAAPSFQPSVAPSRSPSAAPSMTPSSSPTCAPSQVPSVAPSMTPSTSPSAQPSYVPTVAPSAIPSTAPSASPTILPTASPSFTPSQPPTTQPSYVPSVTPTMVPSVVPSASPTRTPSYTPTVHPTYYPTSMPSRQPTSRPSIQPSLQPATKPSTQPSSYPSTQPSRQPSSQPLARPSMQPSRQPSSKPSMQPSWQPSSHPSSSPSHQPSSSPSLQPSSFPSRQPSMQPSQQPVPRPSAQPSVQPTSHPTIQPSQQPLTSPTTQPSQQPSSFPSRQPSMQPSQQPVSRPSAQPSVQPTSHPTIQPSQQPLTSPTTQPSQQPSSRPSTAPSRQPSAHPSQQPSSTPTRQPSTAPSRQPSAQPSASPSRQPSLQPSTQPFATPSRQPSAWPSQQPSSRPSNQPSGRPSTQPSLQPSSSPSRQPSSRPSCQPSAQPSQQPSSHPSTQPSRFPSMQPSRQPSSLPSRQPSSIPSRQPSIQPSSQPSCKPSRQPTSIPSIQPSNKPSTQPSCHPSSHPSTQPSMQPSRMPSRQPSSHPSRQPSSLPSSQPSMQPSGRPSLQPSADPSMQPSRQPSSQPSRQPSLQPFARPSCLPSSYPTFQPSRQPSTQPSGHPSIQPSTKPSFQPSAQPTNHPSTQPSQQPSLQPSRQPSSQPSCHPSAQPSNDPSSQPSSSPTQQPSTVPSLQPSAQPSCKPSKQPSGIPTMQPSLQPSRQPSSRPSMQPSQQPTCQPSVRPSHQPSSQPSRQPSCRPSVQPSARPSHQPSSKPSTQPSKQPVMSPSTRPSTQPSSHPSHQPSPQPSARPSRQPSRQPSSHPSHQPSSQPSSRPSSQPTSLPTVQPSQQPSAQPSTIPTSVPSLQPSCQPSSIPSCQPSSCPSQQPSAQPSSIPSMLPTSQPSSVPSMQPSLQPSSFPTMQPTCQPTLLPSCQPTTQPSVHPSMQPSSLPSCQPSSVPSLATPYAKYLPKLLTNEVTNIGNTSLLVRLTLSTDGLVNFGVFHVSQARSSVTAAVVISLGVSARTSSGAVSRMITGLVPSSSYRLYYVLQSLNGIRSNDYDTRRNENNFTTLCCRTLSMSVTSPSVWMSASGDSAVNTVRNWLSVEVSNAPQLQGMSIALTLTNSSGAVFNTALTPSTFAVAAANSPVLAAPMLLTSTLVTSSLAEGSYAIRMSNSGGYLNAESIVFRVIARDQALPAPSLTSATFAASGSSIIVAFDSATDQSLIPSNAMFSCSQLLRFTCSAQSTCQWTSSKLVSINIAADDKCAAPGDALSLSSAVQLRAQCPAGTVCPTQRAWPIASVSANVTISPPASPQLPTVVLKIPSLIGNCTTLTVDLSSSLGSGGRSWSSSNMTVSGGPGAAKLHSYLASLLYRVFPPIVVPTRLLKGGESYTIIAEMCNFLGACNQASATVTVQSANLPMLSILGSSSSSSGVLTTTRSQALTINSAARLNPCLDPSSTNRLSYSWLVLDSSNSEAVSFRSLSRNPTVLIVPAYTFRAGTSYEVIVTVRLGLLYNNATQIVIVAQGRVSACISGSGSSKLLAVGSSVLLDGSCSRDEDIQSLTGAAAGLLYSWTCSRSNVASSVASINCSAVIDQALFVQGQQSESTMLASLNDAKNVGEVLLISLCVSDATSDPQRSASTSISVTIVQSGAVDISMSSVSSISSSGKVNPGDQFSLRATLQVPALVSGNFSWTTSPAVSSSAVETVTSRTWSAAAQAQVMTSYFVLLPSTLTADVTYSFTISAFGSTVASSNTIAVLVNSPPKPGQFVISPSSGAALVDQFLLYSSAWVDTDLPLSYRYSYLSLSGSELPLRSASEVTFVSVLLPPGASTDDNFLTCYATISDFLEAEYFTSAKVQTIPAALSANESSAMVDGFLLQASLSLNNAIVDDITQALTGAAYLLNAANCSLAPNCSALNRKSCASTAHTCGSCVSVDYVGAIGDANSLCLSLLDLGQQEDDINNSRRRRSLRADEVQQSSCASNCSEHGVCQYFSYRGNGNAAVESCPITAIDCYARCICDEEYAWSDSCSVSTAEIEQATAQRALLINTVASLYTLQNPSKQSLTSSISSLREASQNAYQLTSSSIDLLYGAASTMLADTESNAIETTNVAGLLHVFDSISSSTAKQQLTAQTARRRQRRRLQMMNETTSNETSSAAVDEAAWKIAAAVQNYSSLAARSLLPGQAAQKSVLSNFKLTISNLSSNALSESGSCDSNASLSLPSSSLEQALGIQAPAMNVPLCANGSSTIGVSVLSMSSALFGVNETALGWLTNPLLLSLSSFPSQSASDRVEIVLPMLNRVLIDDVVPEYVQVDCIFLDFSSYNRTCSSGQNVTITCLGEKKSLQMQCPYTQMLPSCDMLLTGTTESESGCYTIAYTEANVTCSCPLTSSQTAMQRSLQNSTDEEGSAIPSGKVSVSYVGLLTAITSSFAATAMSAQGLDGSVLKTGKDALITLGTLIGAIMLAMAWSYRSDVTDRKGKEDDGKSKIRHKQDMKKQQPKTLPKQQQGKENVLLLAEEALPGILASKSFSERIKDEIKRHHRWAGVVFYFSPRFPRVLRVVSLATNVVIMLFMQSVTYNLTKGDDGSCALLSTSETDCLSPSSPYAPGASKCYWIPSSTTTADSGTCAFVEPNNSLKIVLFLAIFSAIVATPIALTVDWLIQTVLTAPTATYVAGKAKRLAGVAPATMDDAAAAANEGIVSLRAVEPVIADDNNNGQGGFGLMRRNHSRTDNNHVLHQGNSAHNKKQLARLVAARKEKEAKMRVDTEFEELAESVQRYRLSLPEEKDRREFEMAWGLDHQTGRFFGMKGENVADLPQATGFASSTVSLFRKLIPTKHKQNNGKDVAGAIHAELEHVHKELRHEQKWLIMQQQQQLGPAVLHHHHHNNPNSLHQSRRELSKRLLFLFQRDLLPGVKGQILEGKDSRNERRVKSVSRSAKSLAWLGIAVLNSSMLFYVFLFAVSQTQVKQQAWAQSFALWLVVEVLFVSSAVVIFMHVLLPSLIMKDVQQIQKKLVGNLKDFYREMQQQKRSRYVVGREHKHRHHHGDNKKGHVGKKSGEDEVPPFNAAAYLFLSHRLASFLLEQPQQQVHGHHQPTGQYVQVAKMILHFSSPWPKQSYQHVVDVSKNYNRKFTALTRSISLVVFYFLTNFLAVPLTIQDMIVHIVATASIGYTVLLHIQLYEIYPALIVIPTVMIAALGHFVIQANRSQQRIQRQKLLQELHGEEVDDQQAKDGEEGDNQDEEKDREAGIDIHRHRPHQQHVNRRQSIQQGLQLVTKLEHQVKMKHDNDHNKSSHVEHDSGSFSLSSDSSSSWDSENDFIKMLQGQLSSGSSSRSPSLLMNDDDSSSRSSFFTDEDDLLSLLHEPSPPRSHAASAIEEIQVTSLHDMSEEDEEVDDGKENEAKRNHDGAEPYLFTSSSEADSHSLSGTSHLSGVSAESRSDRPEDDNTGIEDVRSLSESCESLSGGGDD